MTCVDLHLSTCVDVLGQEPRDSYVVKGLDDMIKDQPCGSGDRADQHVAYSNLLWQQQGQWATAYDLLAPVYSWFPEGADTADLQRAAWLIGLVHMPQA